MEGFRKLYVYQQSLESLKELYTLFSETEIRQDYSLRDQIKRAAMSITANIAEGYGRSTTKDKYHFLTIAIGSTNEVMAFLDIVNALYKIDTSDLNKKYEVLGKQIYKLRKVMK